MGSVVVGPALVKLAVASSTLVGGDSRVVDADSVAGPVFVGCAVG